MAAVTVYSAPDDGRKGRPKHVEYTVVINKHNTARVTSCWFIIYYRFVMHGNSNIYIYKYNAVLSKMNIEPEFCLRRHQVI